MCTLLLAAACDSNTGDEGEGESGADETSSSSTSTSSGTDTGTSDASSSTSGEETGETGGVIVPPDMGGEVTQCDSWTEDCSGENEKCMPWAMGQTWDSTKCVPIDSNPGAVGDPCSAEPGATGIDTCGKHAMCWDTDANGEGGTCIAMCEGTPEAPVCASGQTCVIANEVLALCMPNCDPLLQDCPEGQACMPDTQSFVCGPDASGVEGQYGDPCAYRNVCDPGLICIEKSAVPDCQGSAGCCTEYCDLSDPQGDMQCAGQQGGQVCSPAFDPASTPPGYENVGICAIPE